MLLKRRLGRTGLSVSLLGFGGIPIMRISQQEATRVIGEALRQGVDFFDTARGYGDSERKMGAALGAHGMEVVLASKSPERDKEGLLEDFDKSISQLAVDVIDLYQLHCVNTAEDYAKCMAEGGAYVGLADLRAAGRIRFLGITSHNLDIIRQAIESGRFDTVQVLYSFIEDEASREIIPLALENDIGVIAMKPLAGGCIERYDIALRYVLSTDGIVAIPGMATIDEVRRNVEAACDLKGLTEPELEVMDRIREDLGRRFCRRCDYCQPCPNDIPISMLLHAESIRMRIGDTTMRTDSWKDVLDKANRCDQCGQCEDRCPFGLPVRDLVRASRDVLEEVLR
jgi:predicted aldo/keto reductase-like oxidoreductase